MIMASDEIIQMFVIIIRYLMSHGGARWRSG